ncbi:MAG: hypothetical protein M3R04_02650 [bacterium]|nr:hypothetical protein [bacterium]
MDAPYISLPAQLALQCPVCFVDFGIAAASVSRREKLHCPVCGACSELYDMLDPQLRRRVYQAVRDTLEQRVHEQRIMDDAEYFEDERNI